jgi:hypothetical protein
LPECEPTPTRMASIVMAGALHVLRALTIPLLPERPLWDILWFASMILIAVTIYSALIAAFQRCLPSYEPLKEIAEAITESKRWTMIS